MANQEATCLLLLPMRLTPDAANEIPVKQGMKFDEIRILRAKDT